MASRPAPAKKSAKSAAPAAGRKAAAKTTAPAKKGAAAPRKASAASVVTLKNLAEQIAEAHDLPRRAATAMLEDVVERVTAHLKRGERIRFGALGILEQPSRSHGAQSRDRRGREDQGQQEGRIPGRQGAERDDLSKYIGFVYADCCPILAVQAVRISSTALMT